MNKIAFNDRIRQVIVLALILLIAALLVKQLFVFLPGVLGAFTLYIVSRAYYFNLIFKRKWKKGLTALLFIFAFVIMIALPIYITVTLVSPKISELLVNQDKIVQVVESVSKTIADKTGKEMLSSDNIKTVVQKASAVLPSLLSGTATSLANVFMMFFLLYFLFIGGRDMEKSLSKLIPLKPHNVNILATETKMMIKANALGIPLICIVQGIAATIGYLIFGLQDWALWGFLTGVFAFFPFVGTMIVWVPLCFYLYAQGHPAAALGLALYSFLITGNVDYVARISFMKKIGDVHPLITVLGVIVGLNLFGFVGLIFGPLLISYFLILVKIYVNEFSDNHDIELKDVVDEI
jgi:predicted PurR-regulated permease PerM